MTEAKPTWPADKVSRRAVASLVPYAKNARTHSEVQISQIAASMREWGWTNPVLVDEAGMIIAGHGRVLAAKRLGYAEVPVMVAEGWTEAQKRAYVIADNQLPLNAGWDMDGLSSEVKGLAEWGFDVELLGFEDLDALLADKTAGLTDPDDAPAAPVNPVTRLGDLWLCGRHRVLCGDATKAEEVERVLGGVLPDIANVDAPYGISIVKGSTDGGAKPFGKIGGGKPHPYAGSKPGHEHGQAPLGPALRGRVHGLARKAIIQPGIYAPVIGDDSTETGIKAYTLLAGLGVPVIVIWGGNYFAGQLPASRCWLVWDKENTGSFADAELAWTNQDKIVRVLRHRWSGLMKASERGEKRVHPTQKPVALAEWVIETICPKAKTLIDPFLGSGSALIACERMGLACLGVELAPAYVDVVIERWQNFTGEAATREGDGRTFKEIEDARWGESGRERDSAGSYDAAIEAKRSALADA